MKFLAEFITKPLLYKQRQNVAYVISRFCTYVSWLRVPCPICIEFLSSPKSTINLRRGLENPISLDHHLLKASSGRSLILVRTGKIYAQFVGSDSPVTTVARRSRCMSASAISDANYRSACQTTLFSSGAR